MMQRLTRRDAIRGVTLGAAGAGFAADQALADTAAQPVAAVAATNPQGVCVLLPQAVEGPYYFDPKLVRSDIAEGQQGAAVKLILRVVDANGCAPLSNIRVDIWHADARGIYSGYDGQGDNHDVSEKSATYLRGTQTTDANGIAAFRTVFPGWYPGRTPHIHVKAFLGPTSLVTGQMYFPDDVSAKIFRERAPYSSRPVPDTTNARDGIFQGGQRDGGGTILAVSEDAEYITASLLIGVDKSGDTAKKASGWGGFFKRLIGG